MTSFDNLPLQVFSEYAFGRRLGSGCFDTLPDIPEADFYNYWWKEMDRFEQHLRKQFSPDEVFVSDNVPPSKHFGVHITTPTIASKVFQSLLDYMDRVHPDSSTVIGSVFDAPMPAARLVIWREGCAIEQDALAWFLDRARIEKTSPLNAAQQRNALLQTQITSALPWLRETKSVKLSSGNFWARVYSGQGFHLMEGRGLNSESGYDLGYEIRSRLWQRFILSDDVGEDDIAFDGSLPTHRVLKVECAREVLNAERLREIFQMVNGIHQTWGCRFSVFESLTEPDNYLGGIMITPDGRMFLEENK